MCDNTTAVANVTKQGSVRFKSNNHTTRKIWEFAIERNLWLSIAHCPGSEYTEADKASRVFQDEIEWSLAQGIFNRICEHFGKPDIHLFASRLNHKVPRYCLWQQDPGAVFVDNFLYNWGQGQYVYIFPPFAILHRFHQNIQLEGAEGIIVVPHWPTEPLSIPVTEQVLSIPGRKKTPPHDGPNESTSMPLFQQSLQAQGLSAAAARTISKARRESTKRLYGTYLGKWTAYCRQRDIDPVHPGVVQAINFLQSLIDEPNTTRGYSAVATARSTLSSVVVLESETPLGNTRSWKLLWLGFTICGPFHRDTIPFGV